MQFRIKNITFNDKNRKEIFFGRTIMQNKLKMIKKIESIVNSSLRIYRINYIRKEVKIENRIKVYYI